MNTTQATPAPSPAESASAGVSAPIRDGSLTALLEGAAQQIDAVAKADFDALEARVEALEAKIVVAISRELKYAKSETGVLEGKVKAALAHIGVDIKKFF